nr:uncharacterized protein LOC125420651 [Ziziphus jujuba var. spinosa]
MTLRSDETLISAGGVFELGFFTPNKSTNEHLGIWFKNDRNKKQVGVALREISFIKSTGFLTIQYNGNLVISDLLTVTNIVNSGALATSNETSAKILDTGNLILMERGKTIWQSFDYPSIQTMLITTILALNQTAKTVILLSIGREVIYWFVLESDGFVKEFKMVGEEISSVNHSLCDATLPHNSTGCLALTPMTCKDEDYFTDIRGFILNSGVVIWPASSGHGDCELMCRSNCSCVGYVFLVDNGTGCKLYYGNKDDLLKNIGRGNNTVYVRGDASKSGKLFYSCRVLRERTPIMMCFRIIRILSLWLSNESSESTKSQFFNLLYSQLFNGMNQEAMLLWLQTRSEFIHYSLLICE